MVLTFSLMPYRYKSAVTVLRFEECQDCGVFNMTKKPDWFKGVVVGGLVDKPKCQKISFQMIRNNPELLDWHFESDGMWVEKIPLENVQAGQQPLVSVSIRPDFNIDDVVVALTQVIYDLNEIQL